MHPIRIASARDLEHVRSWLQQEKDEGHESFICNIGPIEQGQREGRLTVLIEHDLPVAFALGIDNFDILAVKRDRQGHGLGRELAEYWIKRAMESDIIGMEGECSPSTSLHFWKKMGCVQIKSNNRNPYVIMPFVKSHRLPDQKPTVDLTFQISDRYGNAIPNWDVVTAAVVEEDEYALSRDFIAYVSEPDASLSIMLDNDCIRDTRLSSISEINGERNGYWIRLRKLLPRWPARS